MAGYDHFGDLRMILNLMISGCSFDLGGCPQREKILPQYKSNRGSPPEGFVEQLEWVKKLSKSLGYGTGEAEGREADDLSLQKLMN